MIFFCYMFSVVLFDTSDVTTCCVCRGHSPKIMIVIFLKRDDSLTSRSVIMRTEQLTKTHVSRTTTVAEDEVVPSNMLKPKISSFLTVLRRYLC